VLTYLLQIKDRHNGNLLIDREGHLIHIDWGFILESSPGGNLGFEAAPFKLPLEYIEVLGGLDSEPWKEFKSLVQDGFKSVRKHCDSIVSEWRFLKLLSIQLSHLFYLAIVELMQKGMFYHHLLAINITQLLSCRLDTPMLCSEWSLKAKGESDHTLGFRRSNCPAPPWQVRA